MGSPASGPNGPHKQEEESKLAQAAGVGGNKKLAPELVKSGPNGPHIAEQPRAADDSGPDGPH
jgi:hypothetical protein